MSHFPPSVARGWQVIAGWSLVVVLILPPMRALLEASMLRHMLLQAPLLLLAGALLSNAVTPWTRIAIAPWNAHGIAGLLAAGCILSLLMLPRVLDLALVENRIEFGKFILLLIAGAALRLSWQPAGVLVQGFFLGNVLPMMAVTGQLYVDSPVRICNAYLLDDQARLGEWLIALTCIVALSWLVQVARMLMMREGKSLALADR